MPPPALLEVRNLTKHFSVSAGGLLGLQRKTVRAVDGVSFTINPGETLGLVGESGCGKSTLARTILFLEEPTSGEILFQGQPLTGERVRDLRRRAQIVFQDPYSSLPPRMKIGDIVGDPLRIHGLAEGNALKTRVQGLEETFGPVAPVLTFSDMEETIAMTNDNDFGLVAGVFTQSMERAYYMAEQIETGIEKVHLIYWQYAILVYNHIHAIKRLCQAKRRSLPHSLPLVQGGQDTRLSNGHRNHHHYRG